MRDPSDKHRDALTILHRLVAMLRAIELPTPPPPRRPSHPTPSDHSADAARVSDGAPSSLRDQMDRYERQLLLAALERTQGNKTHAARHLGITYHGLLKKLRRHGLLGS